MDNKTVEEIVDFLRKRRQVDKEVLKKFEEQKIDGEAVSLLEEQHFETLGLNAMGDQLALRKFCAPNEEKRDKEVEHPREVSNRCRKRSRNADYGCSTVAVKRAKKSTLKVEFGWKHFDGDRYVQVKGEGGGTRTLDLKRSANYQECLLKAQNLFFPDGTSQHGKLLDMEMPYLANYKEYKLNEKEFTVEDYIREKTGRNVPRLYFVTKAKAQADSRPQGNSLSSDTSYATEEISHPQNSDSHVQGKSVTSLTTTGTTQAAFPSVEIFSPPEGENSFFLNCRHDTKDMMSSLLQNGSSSVVTIGPQGNSLSSDTSYATELQYSVQQVPQELPVNFNMMPIFGSSFASEVDSGCQADGNGLSSDRELISSDLDSVLFGDQDLTSSLTNYGESSESPSAHGSDPTTVHQDGDHYSGVSRSVQGISPQEGSTKGGYRFSIFLSKPLPEDVTSGKADFCHVATANLTKLNPHVFQGTVPGSPHPGDVQVTVMTQTSQHLGITHFKYIDGEYLMAMELLSGSANISKLFSIISKKFETSLHVDCSNQTKQQHSLQCLQLLVYTAAQTGEKHLIEIIFSTSAGQIVFDSYKGRAQLPEDVARANGHDDLANYLQDLTTRFSKEPEFTQKEAHLIDWAELEAAATAARTRGCHTEENSSDDRSESNSDTCYFADVETSSIDSPELSRSTSEDDTLEPYSREKTQASAHQSISSIVKGAFAETMQRIRQNIEGVKQKSTVLILEDSHFDSSLPEVVKGLNYALAFQLATGSKNIPRHLHTANERFLASRENIIRQSTISFCKLHPDVLIERSFVKNNNDHILRIDASKQSNQLNEDSFAELLTRIPNEKALPVEWKSSDISKKQFGALTHCDLWVFTSAFRKTFFVYFADRRDALPHSYFFEDEDCESQIRCWKWKRSENNSWKFTERLEAEKLPPGGEQSQMESHADLPVTYIVRDKQALTPSWIHAMMHHCWTVSSTKKTSKITIFVALPGNDGILEDTCGPELGIALAKVKSLTTLHLTINSNGGILERTWETYLYSSLAEIKSLTTLHLTINRNDGIDGWRWAHELGYGLAKIKSLTTLHLTINSNDGIDGHWWEEALIYGLAEIKSLTSLHLTIDSNDGIDGRRRAKALGHSLAAIKSLTTLHLAINSNDGIDGYRWAEALGYGLAEIKSLTTLHLTINSNDGIDGCRWAEALGYSLAAIKSLTTLHLTINSKVRIGGCRWAYALGYGLAEITSLTTVHLTINSNDAIDGIYGCSWAKVLGYSLAAIKSLTTLHLTINRNYGIYGCSWAEALGYGLAEITSLTTLHLTVNSNDGIDGCRWAEKLGYGLGKIKSLTTLHLTINSNHGIDGCRWAGALVNVLAEITSLTTLHLTINSNDGISGCMWRDQLFCVLERIKSLTTLHLKINGNDDIFKGRVTDVDLAHGCFKRIFADRLHYGLAESKPLTEVCLKADNCSSSLDELMLPYPSNCDGSWVNRSGYQKTPNNALHPIEYTSLSQQKPMHDLSGMSYYTKF